MPRMEAKYWFLCPGLGGGAETQTGSFLGSGNDYGGWGAGGNECGS